MLPSRTMGMVAPLLVTSEISYQFYMLQQHMGGPWNVAMAEASLDLRDFSAEALEEADSQRLEPAVKGLVHKGAEFLVLGGVPVVVLASFSWWSDRLKELSEKYDRPFITDFECAWLGLQALGAKKIVVANKWTEEMNKQLAADVEQYGGLEVVGIGSDPHSAAEISGLRVEHGIESCRVCIRAALDAATDTPDAVFLAGGAWFSTAATALLESEFHLPIVTNPGASMWYSLNKMGCYSPAPTMGRLYAIELDD
jgi:maleate cis-trans isomerase